MRFRFWRSNGPRFFELWACPGMSSRAQALFRRSDIAFWASVAVKASLEISICTSYGALLSPWEKAWKLLLNTLAVPLARTSQKLRWNFVLQSEITFWASVAVKDKLEISNCKPSYGDLLSPCQNPEPKRLNTKMPWQCYKLEQVKDWARAFELKLKPDPAPFRLEALRLLWQWSNGNRRKKWLEKSIIVDAGATPLWGITLPPPAAEALLHHPDNVGIIK